ncbi:hypothetical protein OU800_08035 [Pseudomonas sp. GOM7]|uniref:hypothetical protein n=1 Tax=Pseudomonas sp. GOM7 TaxID=2998079 RepID=UPI00227AAEE0|nr:hypothetical protein [Pseudomonas sp. GOM7]WAJ39163.1 hypothetical protein OU800_08035 [Pseudomonas sp. GOM7]
MQSNIVQTFLMAIFFFLSLSVLAEPSKEEFERQVEIEKTEMHSDKSAVEAAYAFCKNLTEAEKIKKITCIAFDKYKSDKLRELLNSE